MSTIELFNFENSELRFVEKDNTFEIVVQDLVHIFEYSESRRVLDLVEEDYQGMASLATPSGLRYFRVINELGLKQFLSRTRKTELAKKFAKHLNLDMHFISDRKEEKHINFLYDCFVIYNPVKNYKIGKYKVDLYLTNINLIIECDENNHRSYNLEKEFIRTQYIKETLSNNIIRFNPDEKNFKIQNVISEILKCKEDCINYKNVPSLPFLKRT